MCKSQSLPETASMFSHTVKKKIERVKSVFYQLAEMQNMIDVQQFIIVTPFRVTLFPTFTLSIITQAFTVTRRAMPYIIEFLILIVRVLIRPIKRSKIANYDAPQSRNNQPKRKTDTSAVFLCVHSQRERCTGTDRGKF